MLGFHCEASQQSIAAHSHTLSRHYQPQCPAGGTATQLCAKLSETSDLALAHLLYVPLMYVTSMSLD